MSPRAETGGPTASGRVASSALVIALAAFALSACGGDVSSGVTVDSSGPVANVEVRQTGGQLVVRWEQTADSASCSLDYELDSGAAGSERFGALTAVPIVEQVFDVSGEVVSATLTCT